MIMQSKHIDGTDKQVYHTAPDTIDVITGKAAIKTISTYMKDEG